MARWAFPDVWSAFGGSLPTALAVLGRWPHLQALAGARRSSVTAVVAEHTRGVADVPAWAEAIRSAAAWAQFWAALARLTELLAELGLRPKPAKTRIVQLTEGGEGVDFLGFHHRLVRSRPVPGRARITFLARWPSRKAMQHARDRIRFMTMRARLAAPVEQVVQEINLFLRGWAGYFRYGNSSHAFDQIRRYALMRLALFLAKRHQRGRAWGFGRIYRSGDDLGLISLNGTVVAPRPNRAWRAPAEHRR